jgi:tetratricopeptide (TPR) repeat protein
MSDPGGPAASEIRSDGSEMTGRRLGPYEVVREIGRGSNGVVYEALDREDRRRLALKVLPANIALDRKTVARFEREASAAASLVHPGIVRVHEIGEVDSTHFFAMDYVEGVALDTYAESRELTVREAARLVRDAARALHHAHENGVVHRDVKPSNLLVRADGAILVTDFGLARLDKSATLTSTDAIVGTPKYMSPEQILAEKGQVDRRTDVYALAVTLFELVTGSHPFEGETVQAFLKNVLEADPVRPRSLNRKIPRALETIVLQAMDRDPDRRYPTALAFAEDLDRFLDHTPIRARRPSVALRALTWSRRHRVAVLTGMLGLAVLATVALVLAVRSGSVRYGYADLLNEAKARLEELQSADSPEDREQRLESVESLLGRAIELSAKRPEAHLLRSRVAFYRGRYDQARSDFDAARDRGASRDELAPMRAHLALLDQDWVQAVRSAARGLIHDKEDADLYYIRGAARYAGGDPERGDLELAKLDLLACLRIDPGHRDASLLLEELSTVTGDREQVDRMAKLREIFEGFGRAGAEGAGLLGAVTDLVSEAARSSPALSTIGRSVFRRLVLTREIGDIEDAQSEEAAATAAIDSDPTNYRAYLRRGLARIRKNDLTGAIADIEEAIRLDIETSASGVVTDWEPCFWDAFLRVTSPDGSLWDEPTAYRWAKHAVELAPAEEAPRARDVLAEVYFRMGDRKEALEVMEKLEEEDPARAAYYERRAAYFSE